MAQKKISLENLIQYDINIKKYITNKLSELNMLNVVVVDELPATNISSSTLYLVKRAADKDTAVTDDAATEKAATSTYRNFTEYLYVNSKWEEVGEVDFYNYYTKDEVDALIADINDAIKYNKDYKLCFEYVSKRIIALSSSSSKVYDYLGNEVDTSSYDFVKKRIVKNIYNGSKSTYVYVGNTNTSTLENKYLNDNFTVLGAKSLNMAEKIAYTHGFYDNLENTDTIDASSTNLATKKVYFSYYDNDGRYKVIDTIVYYDTTKDYTISEICGLIRSAIREAIYCRIEDANVGAFKSNADELFYKGSPRGGILGSGEYIPNYLITIAYSESSPCLFSNHANHFANSYTNTASTTVNYLPVFLPTIKSNTLYDSSTSCKYLMLRIVSGSSKSSSTLPLEEYYETMNSNIFVYTIASVSLDTEYSDYKFDDTTSSYVQAYSSVADVLTTFKESKYLAIPFVSCVNGYMAYPSSNVIASGSTYNSYISSFFE